MLLSEKQKNLSWQIRTKDGQYFQPESTHILYQWIFDNRLCVDDFIFSARDNDWAQIINMPELKGCFWQLLTAGDVVYGPVSIGEMKQLFINNQLTSQDKAAIFGKEGWIKINEVELLHDYLRAKDAPGIDYIQFINKLEEEFESRGGLPKPKEDKTAKKLAVFEQQGKESKKRIEELETVKGELENAKKELEEELLDKKNALEEIITDRNKISGGLQSLQNELKEKVQIIEELNKNIAQVEVNAALKDGESNQLRSDLVSAQEELDRARNENMQLRQSVPDAVRDLKGTIDELNDRNKKTESDIIELQNIINGKEKLLEESNNTINELTVKNRDLEQKILSLGDLILEKDKAMEEKGGENSAYVQELQETIKTKEEGLDNLRGLLSAKGTEIEEYISEIKKLRDEVINKEEIIERTKAGVGDVEAVISSREEEIQNLRKLLSEGKEKIGENEIIINNLKTELAERSRVIEESKTNIEGLGSVIEEKENKIADLNQIISAKEENINGYRESIGRLQGELAEKDREIAGIKDLNIQIEELSGEINRYKQEMEKLNNTVNEKDATISRIDGEKLRLNNEINELKQHYEELIEDESAKFSRELKIREDAINELKHNLDILKEEYKAKIKEWKDAVLAQKAEYEKELSGKTRLWEETFKQEKEKWEKSMQDLEGNLAQKDAQIESQKLEINRLQDALISQDKRWQETFRSAKEEQDRLYNELEKERDDLRTELTQNIDRLISEKDNLQAQMQDLEKSYEETVQSENTLKKDLLDLEGNIAQKDAQIESQKLEITRLQDALISQDKRWQESFKNAKEEHERLYNELEREKDDLQTELTQNINRLISEKDNLQAQMQDLEKSYEETVQGENTLKKDLLDRERFIEQIKDEAKRQKESYLSQLNDANGEIDKLQNKNTDLTSQLQNELDTQDGLRKDITKINEELDNIRQISAELQNEKSQLNREMEETKRSLEHAEEENRSLQKQFYLEKQKLTKEYTETINKLDKLQKRSQLEREIQDRSKMKEELERLYNLLKENFEGMQKGAGEIQSSLQNLSSDIDDKRLSLKYLNETGKREEKKGKSYQPESTEESDVAL